MWREEKKVYLREEDHQQQSEPQSWGPAALPTPLSTSPLGKIKNSGGMPRKLDLQCIFSSMSALNPDGTEDLGKYWWTDHRSWH